MKTPNCTKCDQITKISSTYPDMWFCSSCGHGDYLKKDTPSNNLIKTGFESFKISKGIGKTLTTIPAPSFKEKDQDYVYHVAHPNVKGLIVGTSGSGPKAKKLVIFETPVSFPNCFPKNTGTLSKKWICSPQYLYDSQSEALKNHDPKFRRKT